MVFFLFFALDFYSDRPCFHKGGKPMIQLIKQDKLFINFIIDDHHGDRFRFELSFEDLS